MTSQYWLNRHEKEEKEKYSNGKYIKKCPQCGSRKVANGSNGFHCLVCNYRNLKVIPKNI